MNRNPKTCPHSITDVDDGEYYCTECGIVLEEQTEEAAARAEAQWEAQRDEEANV